MIFYYWLYSNITYRNLGYTEGYADGLDNVGEIQYTYHTHGDGYCNEVPVYHKHSGSKQWGAASGCYKQCGNTTFYDDGTYWKCKKCGCQITYSHLTEPDECKNAVLNCTKNSTTLEGYECSVTEGSIISATIVFN